MIIGLVAQDGKFLIYGRGMKGSQSSLFKASKDQSDPPIHQWSIGDSQKNPQTSGHQSGFLPTQYP